MTRVLLAASILALMCGCQVGIGPAPQPVDLSAEGRIVRGAQIPDPIGLREEALRYCLQELRAAEPTVSPCGMTVASSLCLGIVEQPIDARQLAWGRVPPPEGTPLTDPTPDLMARLSRRSFPIVAASECRLSSDRAFLTLYEAQAWPGERREPEIVAHWRAGCAGQTVFLKAIAAADGWHIAHCQDYGETQCMAFGTESPAATAAPHDNE